MAGNLPVPQGVEAKLVWTLNGQPFALNILHYRHELGATMTQAKANAIDTAWKAIFTSSGVGGGMFTGLSLARVETRHMDQLSDPWYVGATAPVPGTGAGHPLPAATSFVVTLRTGLRGRSFNGRVYLAGWTEDVNDVLGGITSAAAANAVSFITNGNNDMSFNQQMTGCVLSRYTTPPGSLPGAPAVERNPPILTQITSILANDLRWDVQRRRAKPGV